MVLWLCFGHPEVLLVRQTVGKRTNELRIALAGHKDAWLLYDPCTGDHRNKKSYARKVKTLE
eukprot:1543067-Amphidinium_carterae.1